MKITAHDIPQIDRDILLIAVANGKFYGGGFKAAPYASLHDSKIDVSIVEKISRATFISLVGKYKKGEHLDTAVGKKCVTYFKTDSLSIEFDQERKICIDGELETQKRLDISIEHDCASFIIPNGSQELDNTLPLADDVKIVNCSSLVH
jgi:diacylglycerol kinase family enzyme